VFIPPLRHHPDDSKVNREWATACRDRSVNLLPRLVGRLVSPTGAVPLIATLVLVGCASTAGLGSSTTPGVSSAPTASGERVPRWSPPIAIPSQTGPNALGGAAIACPDRSFCVATNSSGGALSYDGRSWTPPQSIDPGQHLAAISCPSRAFCVVADGTGNTVTYDGSTWSPPVAAFHSADGLARLSISCASRSFCMLMGSSSWSAYDGRSWSPETDDPTGSDGGAAFVSSVSCVSPSFCVAVSGPDALSYDGSGWSAAVNIDTLGANLFGTLESVSCPSASFCAAVDGTGDVVIDHGGQWSSPTETGIASESAPGSGGVSCSGASFCVALGGTDATIYNGSTWSTAEAIAQPATTSSLLSISCPSVSSCIALQLTIEAAVSESIDFLTFG
jgi:hypothetical protein